MPKQPARTKPATHLEVVVPEGLEAITLEELRQLGRSGRNAQHTAPGVIKLADSGDTTSLLALQSAISIYLVQHYAVPRPRALLGDEHLRSVLQQIKRVRRHQPQAFERLYLSAAGADSPVLSRLKQTIAGATGLQVGSDDGDLFLRLRRTGTGWDVLVRLTPRPLATRAWRVCNREGALNGAVAFAMGILSQPEARDRVLNIGCGSGSLLIERLRYKPAQQAIGCDIAADALACAHRNLEAAGLSNKAELHPWDARHLPLDPASIDVILADLPFGHLVGSHAENLELYPALLTEAARIARTDARCVLISHEIRLMQQLLAETKLWQILQEQRVDLGGLRPRIFVLRRTPASIANEPAAPYYSNAQKG
jgi:tRNA (guanine6-N2)-methyltransferase